MAISDDFTIDYVNQRVTHTSGTAIYTVNQLYSYLQDTFDDLDQIDDTVPMSAQTPTDYTLTNEWFMDETTFQYLKGGAIKTDSHNGKIQILTLSTSGYTAAVSGDIGKTVTDDGADRGPLLAYDNSLYKWWIRSSTGISSGSTIAITSGTGAGTAASDTVTGENLWPNVYTLGTIEEDDNQQIYIMQNESRIFSGSEWWPESGSGTRHIDVLIKTKEAGTEIDNGQITVFLRHYPATGNADLYDHFGIDLSSGGRNAVPLATSPDLNNTSTHTTVSTYSDITIAFVNGEINYSAVSDSFTDFETVTGVTSGATAIFLKQTTTTGAGTLTLGNISGTFQSGETLSGASVTALSSSTVTAKYTMGKAFTQGSEYPYSVIIDCASRPLSEVYEYLKYVTRIGSTFTMYPTTTDDSNTTWSQVEGQLYIRAHEDNQTSPSNTFSPVKASPFGTFAGGKLFGAQGVWVENMDSADVQNFQLIDSNNLNRTPPNQINIAVTNTLASDRVAVFRTTGGQGSTTIDKSVFTAAASNSSGNTDFIVTTAIPSDTPASGSIRIVDVDGTGTTREKRHIYTAWSGSTFSGLSPALQQDYVASTDTAYVPFIDSEATTTSISTTVVYAADRYILVRVRRYTTTAILPFQTTGTVVSTGYNVATIRTTDSIVS